MYVGYKRPDFSLHLYLGIPDGVEIVADKWACMRAVHWLRRVWR